MLADDLRDWLKDWRVGIFTELTPKSRRDGELEADLILATHVGMGKLVDVPGLEMMINAVPLSGATAVKQVAGRLRGKNGAPPVLFDLEDASVPQCKRAATKRVSALKGMASSILKMEF